MNAQQDKELLDKVNSLTQLIREGFDRVSDRIDKVEERLHRVEDGLSALDRRANILCYDCGNCRLASTQR